MSRLGKYLLKQGLLTREQLEEATQHQAVYGARLGTNLVELEMMSVEHLAECLSDFHKVPLPPRKWLERPQRAAVKRVSRPLVERIRFLPMRLDGNVLHVAIMDPNDPRVLDDVRFATGCRIEPYVLPEIWMHDWLLALFEIPRGIRHIVIVSRRPPPEPSGEEQRFDFGFGAVQTQAAPGVMSAPIQVVSAPPPPPQPAASSRQAVAAARQSATAAAAATAPSRQPAAATRRQPAVARITFDDAANAVPTRSVVKSKAEPPVAPNAVPPGASVRPPPITIRSLADLAAGVARPAFEGPLAEYQPEQPNEPPSLFEQRHAQSEPWVDNPNEEPEVTLLPAAPSPPQRIVTSARPPQPELAELETALLQVSEREQLIELSFSIASRFAPRVALFIVQRGMVQGVRCVDHGGARAIDSVLVPVDAVSMLAQAAKAPRALRFDPRVHALDVTAMQLLGEDDPSEVGLFPVAIKQRIVNVLYASNGKQPLGPIAFAALAQLAEQIAIAYGRLIMNRKGGG